MVNTIVMVGRLGKNPTVRSVRLQTGEFVNVTALRICSNVYTGIEICNIGGRVVQNWFTGEVWGERFLGIIQRLRQGSLVYVTGVLHQNHWESEDRRPMVTDKIDIRHLAFVPTEAAAADDNTEQEASESLIRQERRRNVPVSREGPYPSPARNRRGNGLSNSALVDNRDIIEDIPVFPSASIPPPIAGMGEIHDNIEVVPPQPPPMISANEAVPTRSGNARRPRTCTRCRGSGHTRNRCPENSGST